MYHETTQQLKVRNKLTKPFSAYRGVRQGCVLSPLLFNIYVNDLPKSFNESCSPVQLENLKINCLMYADDIILLSESEEGLKQCLNNLSLYNRKWCLNINETKTKIITFQNGGKIKQLKIKYDNQYILEQVNKIKYLGNIISNTGSFKQNDIYLKIKGLRAYYALLKKISFNIKPSLFIKLFEKVIEPIILYNSEITTAYIPNKWNYQYFKENVWDIKLKINNVLYSFIKQILGVTKYTSNIATLAECGKFPLQLKIYVQIIKYWMRLFTSDSKYMQQLHLGEISKCKDNKMSWLKIVEYLIDYTDTKKYFGIKEIISKPKKLIEIFESKLKTLYKKWWKENIIKESKMKFYSEYKKEFRFESYIDNLNWKKRKIVCKFRLSNHILPIEKLRYSNIKRDERLCPICNIKEIGDEYHYLLKCTNNSIEKLRDNFKNSVIGMSKELRKLDIINIIKYCINMCDPIIQNITAKYIEDIFINFENEKNIILNK